MKQKITLKKIAHEFGVSISTVSKALKDSHEISSEVKAKIKEFAASNNYKPNSLALNLRNQNTKTVGVIIPEIVHHFFAKVISGIEELANEKGYNVIICLSNESHEKEALNLEMLANGVVDGVIISLSKETEEKDSFRHLTNLIKNGIPLVMFDRVVDKISCNKVIADDVGGAFSAVEHMIQNGCSKIALVTTPDYVIVGHDRKLGYMNALKEYKLNVRNEHVIMVQHESEIEDPLTKLLMQKDPPDGIFAVNEVYAAVAMNICKSKGYKIPDQIEVIGFTDGLISEFTTPSLTTVAQHGRAMGKKALELLLREIESNEVECKFKTAIIKTDLIIRNSTKKAYTPI